MKRLALTAAIAATAGGALAAAPALSDRHWQPQAEQFSLPTGAADLKGDPGARSAGVVSEPLRAPGRFNLVGLTWDGGGEPGIAIRTRRDEGRWSPWTTVYRHHEDGPDPGTGERLAAGTSNPTWAGEADWIQYRSSEQLRGARLRFVNVAGSRSRADRALTALRRGANTAATAIAGALGGGVANAQEGQPAMVSRAAWGASQCRPRTTPAYGEVRAAFVHHTVNANDYSAAEAPDVVLGICLYHRNTNGWNDIGYNFLVDRFGTLYEGRAGGIDQAVMGAQAQGFNAQTTGIANLGTFTSRAQSAAAIDAMARLIRWKLPLHGVATAGKATLISAGGSTSKFPAGRAVTVNKTAGHRDTNATSCPGDALYAQLPQLRAAVGDVHPSGVRVAVSARSTARRSTITYGESTTVVGAASIAGASIPLAGQQITIEANVRGRWRKVGDPVTDAAGNFGWPVSLRRTRNVRARFAGAGELRPASSPSFQLGVRPEINFRRRPRSGRRGRRVALRGNVRPRKARLYRVLQQRRRGRWRKVGTLRFRTDRRGNWRNTFVPASTGRYRFYVVAKADPGTVRGATPKRVIRITR